VKLMSEDILKIGDLKPSLRNIRTVVKVVSVGEVRTIVSRRDGSEHKVAEAFVGDETGSILLTLWDNQINAFSKDSVYDISGAYTSLYKGSLRLSLGRQGKAEKVDKEMEVNTKNNLSLKVYEVPYWRAPTSIPFRRRRRR